MSKFLISVIIVSYNDRKHLKLALNSVINSDFSNYEIIVIDDASTDGTFQLAKKFEIKKNIRFIINRKNEGASKSRNIGVKNSHSPFLLFIDADTTLEKNSLTEIINKFKKDHRIGVILLQLINPVTKLLDSAGTFLTFIGFPYELGAGENPKMYQKELNIFAAKTAGLALRKKAYENVGGFDEDYLIYGEDTDLCWRLQLAGYKIIYSPEIQGCHYQKGSLKDATKIRLYYEGTKNNLSNLLKNMPIKILVWMLPLHIFFLILLTVKLLMQKRGKMAKEVLKGTFWNIVNIQKTVKKRQLVRKYLVHDRNIDIMFGPITIKEVISKGWRWFLHV